uniref:Uncharacterized protein n=1 Tax=Arundo donax TaxID=35708 RepID=A0A0A9BSX6_ARUDO
MTVGAQVLVREMRGRGPRKLQSDP